MSNRQLITVKETLTTWYQNWYPQNFFLLYIQFPKISESFKFNRSKQPYPLASCALLCLPEGRNYDSEHLTLTWSRGVPMDPKISFRAAARKRKVSWCCRYLNVTCLPPYIFWHVFEKNCAARCAAIALGSLWTPLLTTNGTTLYKINFPHTRDLWLLVAIHKCELMILSHINTNWN